MCFIGLAESVSGGGGWLIIQEELEETLTGFHIQLEPEERLRGKSEPGGGVAVSGETRQREAFESEEQTSQRPSSVALANSACDMMLSLLHSISVFVIYD